MAAALWMVWDERDTTAPVLETDDPAKAARVAIARTQRGEPITLEEPTKGLEFLWMDDRWQPVNHEEFAPAEICIPMICIPIRSKQDDPDPPAAA